jgi:cell wall-associated NlpC family hydrolase
MSQKIKFLLSFLVLLLITFLFAQSAFAYSSGDLAKNGMRGELVTQLQKDLVKLGYMNIEPTGYFGSITKDAVKNFQKKYGLAVDGVAGEQTFSKLDAVLGRQTIKTASRSASSDVVSDMITYAKRFLGTKYVWGGTTTKGFDCSGFVKYVFSHFDISLSRTSSAQSKCGTYVKKSNLVAGDLVFFDTNGGKKNITHVGIYIGGGKFIHASSSHKKVVISDITSGYYSQKYITARRVI